MTASEGPGAKGKPEYAGEPSGTRWEVKKELVMERFIMPQLGPTIGRECSLLL